MYFFCILWFYFLYISFMFYGSIKAITEAMHKWFYFQVPPVSEQVRTGICRRNHVS